jgi:ribose transport system substrate-binding protein
MRTTLNSRSTRRRLPHWLIATAVGVVAATTLVACQSTSSTGGSSNSGSDTKNASLQKEVDAYTAMPTAKEPGPAFDASKAKGKSLWIIPTSSSVPIIKLQGDAIADALKPLGVKVVNYSADGSPGSWVTAMNQAIANKADAIVLQGIDPTLLEPQLAAAKAAGIPTVWGFAIEGAAADVAPQVTATVPLPFELSSKLMADLAILHSDGPANVELFGLKTQRQNPVYTDGITAELKAQCPDCVMGDYHDVPIPNWSQELTSEVRNLVTSKPKANVLIPYFDGMVQFMEPGVTQAGAGDSVRIVSHDGTPSVLTSIKNGNVVVADVGTSNKWQAWATADQALRVMTGTAPVADEGIPVRIWTKKNIDQATGDNAEGGYGDSYVSMYQKLWGVG